MKSSETRQSFLEFFRGRDHRQHDSAPLVPHGDPTLLFTNAGMVQFKSYFLGLETPEHRRAVTVQKCLRVSGKHNDLENVGPSPRHHTFFEMLGNFSFGDYFKEEAIELAWELVTGVWSLPVEHLFATVFTEDDEAHELWSRISTLPPERILRCGAEDNFWAMGETGPCGPCSEIFVDTRPDEPAVDWEEGTESGRYLEIWNLVFMQFERDESGEMRPLPRPSIDTGAGLERLSAVLQGVPSNYDTDLFRPLLDAAAVLAETEYGADDGRDVSLRVVADHLRAVSFLLADGVIPGNEGRGYVLRRILRRAVRHGMRLGLEEPFLHRLVPVVGEVLDVAYPELTATREASVATVKAEEEKFLETLASGARQVQEEIDASRKQERREIPGPAVFRLYDTHGLPLEVIREIAQEEQMGVDEAGFEKALEEQKARSRAVADTSGAEIVMRGLIKDGSLESTPFLGYNQTRLEGARVLKLTVGGTTDQVLGEPVDHPVETVAEDDGVQQGEDGIVVFDRTVFYAESGGQVGDRGTVTWDGGRARVTDTQRRAGVIFHFVTVETGRLTPDAEVTLQVEESRRRDVQLHHTATHLLHAALQEILGEGVRQAGSLVAPDRLRFDFTHPRPVDSETLRRIEDRVNHWIRRAQDTVVVADRSREEALAAGAMALFGEKYGERVRTVEIPGVSLELCGGCHVGNTGEIGLFTIVSEKGIASGVRRIEALTGRPAFEHLRERSERLAETERSLGVPAERLGEEIDALREEIRGKDDKLSQLRMKLVTGAAADGGGDEAERVGDVDVLVREVPWAPAGELRNMADTLLGRLGSGVAVVGSRGEGKVTLIATVSDDLAGERLHAGNLVRELAKKVGGGGGGRPDFAQAGGKDADALPAALKAVPDLVRAQLDG